MYGLRCFILQNAMKAVIAAEKPIFDLTDGKLGRNRFLSAVKTQYVGTSVKILKSTENSTYIAKMNPDGSFSDDDFRILCTTDLHIDEDYELNNRTLQHLADRIADLKPDLVVLTGDCILSKFQQIDAIQFAKMMENIGVYWTYVFGNHEAREEKGSFKYQFYKSFTDSPYCLCKFVLCKTLSFSEYNEFFLECHGKPPTAYAVLYYYFYYSFLWHKAIFECL